MKRLSKIILAALSGILLSLAYYQWGTGFIMFIGLVPLMIVEEEHYKNRKRNKTISLFWYVYITMLMFTGLSVWWVWFATPLALIAAFFVNVSFMLLPFMLFHYVKRHAGPRLGYLALITLWLAFEYLFLNVKVNFPWIIFGNAFAKDILFIQWYDITGTLGGSLWILIMNVLFFELYKGLRKKFSFRANRATLSWILGFLIIPIAFSLIRFYTYEEEERPHDFVVLQPNIDPWKKFEVMRQSDQTDILIKLAEANTTPSTDYVIGPETFLNQSVWQFKLRFYPDVLKIEDFINTHKNVNFIIGAMTLKRYEATDSLSATAKKLGDSGYYYDSYNSALQLDRSGEIQMYHKSLLVTGAEWMPSFKRLKFLQNLTVDLGGITRSHGTQAERDVFVSPVDGTKVAPVICWESVFGEYVTDYISKKGAEYIVIITNDGWWRDTPGHRQHNDYAHLRAIETRRSVARSANTGISSLINQRGEEITRLGWWKRGAVTGTLNANDHLTFYVKHGDYLARIAAFVAVVLVLFAMVRKRLTKE